jgi:hypothetical protein
MIEYVGYDPAKSGDDGTFWMPFDQLQGRFTNASAVRKVKLVNDGGAWTKSTVQGSWTRAMTIKFMSDYATKGFEQYVLEPKSSGNFIVQLNQLPVSEIRSENLFASVDCAIFGVQRRTDSGPISGPMLIGDDFKKFQDESGNVIPPAATRLDERVSSAVDDEQEAIKLFWRFIR